MPSIILLQQLFPVPFPGTIVLRPAIPHAPPPNDGQQNDTEPIGLVRMNVKMNRLSGWTNVRSQMNGCDDAQALHSRSSSRKAAEQHLALRYGRQLRKEQCLLRIELLIDGVPRF